MSSINQAEHILNLLTTLLTENNKDSSLLHCVKVNCVDTSREMELITGVEIKLSALVMYPTQDKAYLNLICKALEERGFEFLSGKKVLRFKSTQQIKLVWNMVKDI